MRSEMCFEISSIRLTQMESNALVTAASLQVAEVAIYQITKTASVLESEDDLPNNESSENSEKEQRN
ncbi:hypothetical protein EVAR_59138_1 [Eumeta japonica]|uniref:Uncharacterized protein n=1 Tax=Eumeta variegata TaxID=151549 RepID=A0A4C1ZBC0_EUMVA|nr:hypothetical protein EVAR_59138_1 [Eumeta japonica]